MPNRLSHFMKYISCIFGLCIFGGYLIQPATSVLGNYLYIMHRFECIDIDSRILYNMSCTINNINQTFQKLSVHQYLQPNVTLKKVSTIGNLNRLDPNDRQFKPYAGFVNYTFEFCDIINARTFSFSILKQVALKIFEKYGNLMHCPHKGHVYLEDIVIETEDMAKLFLYGSYTGTADFYTPINGIDKKYFQAQFRFAIKPVEAVSKRKNKNN